VCRASNSFSLLFLFLNLNNQEKAWIAEQKKEAESNKTKELARQIQQEREQDELDRISGKKTLMDRGIDWMYQGGTSGDLAKEARTGTATTTAVGPSQHHSQSQPASQHDAWRYGIIILAWMIDSVYPGGSLVDEYNTIQ
jgi:predicted phage gp36 major capsid-like protein